MIADLAVAGSIASGTYECVVVTQTLQHVADVHAATFHIHRILKPDGVALVTARPPRALSCAKPA